VIHARRKSSIVASVHRNGYVMSVFGAKNDVNVFVKNTVLGALKIRKGSVWHARACLPNVQAIVSQPLFRIIYYAVYAYYADCCARRLLAAQPDFTSQKCEIEERVRDFPGGEGLQQVIYYPKFHCELNHIEYFWCHSKRYARENCDYSIDGLRKTVPLALQSVKNSTILACYKSCKRKMEFYRRVEET
jgi:hypothetical protein